MSLQADISNHYNRKDAEEKEDFIRWEYNEPILKEIERQQKLIENAEEEIEKLKSQLLND